MRIVEKGAATYSLWQERDRKWFEANPEAKWRLRRAWKTEFLLANPDRIQVRILDPLRAPGKRFRSLVVKITDKVRCRIPVAIDREGRHWSALDQKPEVIPLASLAARVSVDCFPLEVQPGTLDLWETGDACFVCKQEFVTEMTVAYRNPDFAFPVSAHVRCATSPTIDGSKFIGVTAYIPKEFSKTDMEKFLSANKSIELFGTTYRLGADAESG